MHVATLLKADMFDIRLEDRASNASEIFPDWNVHDRFGLVIDEAFGGVGATHLLQVAMMAFYDVRPSRRAERAVYPEIYAFHIGKGHGAHAPYDFWPARREVMLSMDHRAILDAINDRGITRLAVPDRPPRSVEHRPKEEDAAFDRIASAFVYHPSGRVAEPDLVISGNDKRTEYNPGQVLKPLSAERIVAARPTITGRPVKETEDSYMDWLRLRAADTTDAERAQATTRRETLRQDGLVSESYRRVSVREALQRLASAGMS